MNLRKKIIILTSILIFILMASGIVFGAYSYKRSVSSKDIDVGKLEINSKNFINYSNEPITPKFNVINNYPPVVRCHYCGKLIKTEDIEKQFE